MQQPFIQYNQSRNAISEVSEGARGTVAVTSIKDMPAFDPDADINGIRYNKLRKMKKAKR